MIIKTRKTNTSGNKLKFCPNLFQTTSRFKSKAENSSANNKNVIFNSASVPCLYVKVEVNVSFYYLHIAEDVLPNYVYHDFNQVYFLIPSCYD